MSEVKLVIRDATRNLSITCHGSDAHRVVAALSADPETYEELEAALERFMNPNPYGYWRGSPDSIDDEPWDAGLVIVDLPARLIVIDSSYFWTGHSGQVFYQNGNYRTNVTVGYSLSDDWLIEARSDGWQSLAEQRRAKRAANPPLDARAILYGRPLIEFLATECWSTFPQVANSTTHENAEQPGRSSDRQPLLPHMGEEDEQIGVVYEALKDIHARWLLTPREDLRSQTPREILIAKREQLSLDMQQRSDQWARTQECPRGLDATSHAYRFAGFGTHEIVKYYDLVREMLWSCWDQLTKLSQTEEIGTSPSHGLSTFLATEIPRLENFRDEWLNAPDPNCHLRTPQSMIDRERARIPESLSGKEAMLDPDCPCCQMLAELPGPTFLHLDGSGMDWEFAFDIYCQTREEWEQEQANYEEYQERSKSEDQSCCDGRAGSEGGGNFSSVWKRSFSTAESSELPLGVRLLGIAWHVAELVAELNELIGTEPIVDELNRDFRNLREVIIGPEDSRIESLLEPVIDRLELTLATIGSDYIDLESRCADLSRKLDSFRHVKISGSD